MTGRSGGASCKLSAERLKPLMLASGVVAGGQGGATASVP